MKRQVPELRMVLVAGPRVPRSALPEHAGLEVLPYVHNLFEHLACSDLALVQGGLSTCMELVATRRRFLSFPLERHFEQCIHVRAPAAQLLRRLRGALSRAHDRGAGRAGACGDALAGGLPARRNRRCGARGAADRLGDGEPRMGIAMTPIDPA